MVWLTAALVLVLAAAVAVAAGTDASAKYDAKLLGIRRWKKRKALRRIWTAFRCTVGRKKRETVVTTSADEDWRFCVEAGDYIVTIRDGKAEASWSNDGEAVGDFSSDVWDTALWRAASRGAKAGEEWYEITGETLETGESLAAQKDNAGGFGGWRIGCSAGRGMLAEQEALDLARQALEGDGGISAEALNDPENELYAVCQRRKGRRFGTSGFIARRESASSPLTRQTARFWM